MTGRVVSVGVSRLFRLVEVGPTAFRIEQAVKDKLTKKWKWVPLALATEWNEAHGALHQMQADLGDQLQARQQSFSTQRFS